MPNKENLTKWVEALESGNYIQGYNRLCRKNQYCCLGVACELYRNEFPEKCSGVMLATGAIAYKTKDDLNWLDLPDEIANWLGIEDASVSVPGYDDSDRTPLAHLNDVKVLPFIKIAELIRKEYDL